MTALLVVVTLVSLGVAGALLAYVLRLTREERDRSDARAAALSALLNESADAEGSANHAPPLRIREPLGRPSLDDLPTSSTATASHVRPTVHELPLEHDDEPSRVAGRAPMFGVGVDQDESSRPRLLLVPVIGVLIVGLALSGIYFWNRSEAGATVAAAQADAAPSLELVSLRHHRKDGALIVSGLVRNPHSGTTVKGLSAVAFSFDRQGTFLTSARAPLDFRQLAAGDESPFAITLTPATSITRYRVSFRTDEGMVRHVDRRSDHGAVLTTTAQQ